VGALTLPPPGGRVYLDANAFIYGIERVAPYYPLIRPVWQASARRALTTRASELLIVESLTGPLKRAEPKLVGLYERVLGQEVELFPVTAAVLRSAAALRAAHGMKTPDAIHAATALAAGCDLFLTNDDVFKRVSGLPVVVLKDVLASP
jgi:predicted nucleic acid-binding protein